jgi:DNA-binding NtrC family response regulator
MSDAAKATVLVVDDERDVCHFIEKTLNRFQYKTVAAYDGDEALRRLDEGQTIDLVLTDVRMPKSDGMTLLRCMQRIRPSVPIVLMTGFGRMDQYLEAMNMGAFDYLPKPFGMLDLLRTVERAVAGPSRSYAASEALSERLTL